MYVSLLLFLADVVACPAENDVNYEIPWPSVNANMGVNISCPNAAGMYSLN